MRRRSELVGEGRWASVRALWEALDVGCGRSGGRFGGRLGMMYPGLEWRPDRRDGRLRSGLGEAFAQDEFFSAFFSGFCF